MNLMQKLLAFLRREAVLCLSLCFALCTMFLVPPDSEYFSYLDYRTLSLLLCLMAVVCGFQRIGLFQFLAAALLKRAKTMRQISVLLISLCFFSSMVITNDVALITFVPLSIQILTMAGQRKQVLLLLTLQTIAANLGSMLTPMGNPQNLYLYSISGISLGRFVALLLPYTLISYCLLLIACLFIKKTPICCTICAKEHPPAKVPTLLYCLLFLLCLSTVARLVPYPVSLAVVLLFLFFYDKAVLKQVDYSLLLTFVGFFLFVGNLQRIPAFHDLISSLFSSHELSVSILLSQIISNVPAALLLSGFTNQYSQLIVGVNLGGLGTLIASMASLITYKYLAQKFPDLKMRYLLCFTALNLAFLFFLSILAVFLLF